MEQTRNIHPCVRCIPTPRQRPLTRPIPRPIIPHCYQSGAPNSAFSGKGNPTMPRPACSGDDPLNIFSIPEMDEIIDTLDSDILSQLPTLPDPDEAEAAQFLQQIERAF